MSKFQFEYHSFDNLDHIFKTPLPDFGCGPDDDDADEQLATSQGDRDEDCEAETNDEDWDDEDLDDEDLDDEDWDDEELDDGDDEEDFEIDREYPSRIAKTRSHDAEDEDEVERSKRNPGKRRGEDRSRRGRTWLDDDER